MLAIGTAVLSLAVTGTVASAQPGGDPTGAVRGELQALALLAGEPRVVSAGGMTRDETPLLTLENGSPFGRQDAMRRLVLVGGLDGNRQSARIVLDAVRWFKTAAPAAARARWAVSALPFADLGGLGGSRPYEFPPTEGFFDDPDRPESNYVWRWVTYQAPDLVVVVRAGEGLQITPAADADPRDPGGALAVALTSRTAGTGAGPVDALQATARASDGAALMRGLVERIPASRSPLRQALDERVGRRPLQIARLLAGRYPATAGVAYIPAVAWVHTLRLGDLTGEAAWRTRVLDQVRPWLSGERATFGDTIRLPAVAGTMVFAEIATRDGDERAAATRAGRGGRRAGCRGNRSGLTAVWIGLDR